MFLECKAVLESECSIGMHHWSEVLLFRHWAGTGVEVAHKVSHHCPHITRLAGISSYLGMSAAAGFMS